MFIMSCDTWQLEDGNVRHSASDTHFVRLTVCCSDRRSGPELEEFHDLMSNFVDLPSSYALEQLQLPKLLMPVSPGTRSGAARVHKRVSRTEITPRTE